MAQYSLFVLKVPLNTNKPNQSFYPLMGGQLIFSWHRHGHPRVLYGQTACIAVVRMTDGSIDKLKYLSIGNKPVLADTVKKPLDKKTLFALGFVETIP